VSEFFRDQLTLTVTADTTWRVELSVHGLAVMDDGREFVMTFEREHYGDGVVTAYTRCQTPSKLRTGEGLELFDALRDQSLPLLHEETLYALVTHVTLQFD
jgi:hypothetical protein